MFYFYNTFCNLCNISSFFSRIIISSIGSRFSIVIIWLTYCLCNLISSNFTCFMDYFFGSILVLCLIIVFFFFFFFFLQIMKLHYFYLLISNVKLSLSSIFNSVQFWSVNFIKISSNLALYVSKNTKLLGSTFNK